MPVLLQVAMCCQGLALVLKRTVLQHVYSEASGGLQCSMLSNNKRPTDSTASSFNTSGRRPKSEPETAHAQKADIGSSLSRASFSERLSV